MRISDWSSDVCSSDLLQLEAVRERFSERRGQIKVLDKRAKETGVDEITSLDDVVPLLFAHTNYKSYPEAFIDSGQWKHMNVWLRTLCTYPTDDIEVTDVLNVDDRAEERRVWKECVSTCTYCYTPVQ